MAQPDLGFSRFLSLYGSGLALVTRDICWEERKGSRSHIWDTQKVRVRLQGPQPTCVHITLDPVAGGAGVTQHPTSPHLHFLRDCSFGFSAVQSRCLCISVRSPQLLPTSAALGPPVGRHRCGPYLILKATADFVGLQFITVCSSLSTTPSSLPHFSAWPTQRLHLLILRWGAQPTRDYTTSSHTCRLV